MATFLTINLKSSMKEMLSPRGYRGRNAVALTYLIRTIECIDEDCRAACLKTGANTTEVQEFIFVEAFGKVLWTFPIVLSERITSPGMAALEPAKAG